MSDKKKPPAKRISEGLVLKNPPASLTNTTKGNVKGTTKNIKNK